MPSDRFGTAAGHQKARAEEGSHPKVLQLLTQAIGHIDKSKRNVLDFFKGTGVPAAILAPSNLSFSETRAPSAKYEIARQALVRLNDTGDAGLGLRREGVQRVGVTPAPAGPPSPRDAGGCGHPVPYTGGALDPATAAPPTVTRARRC
jgi:hypothetical protein